MTLSLFPRSLSKQYMYCKTAFPILLFLNHLVNFDQACIDTLFEVGKRVDNVLVTLTLFSRSHDHFKMPDFFTKIVPAPSARHRLNGMMDSSQALHIVFVLL